MVAESRPVQIIVHADNGDDGYKSLASADGGGVSGGAGGAEFRYEVGRFLVSAEGGEVNFRIEGIENLVC